MVPKGFCGGAAGALGLGAGAAVGLSALGSLGKMQLGLGTMLAGVAGISPNDIANTGFKFLGGNNSADFNRSFTAYL